MRMRPLLIVLCLAFLSSEAMWAEDPKIRDFDLRTIERLGQELYQRDHLASIGTDLMLEKFPDAPRRPIRGWISQIGEGSSMLYFVQERDDRVSLAYTVLFPKDGDPEVKDQTGEALPEAVRVRYRARQAALAVLPKMHTPRTNLEVIDDPDGSGFLVYILSSTTEPDEMVLGGHYRITVAADGRTVETIDALARSLLILPIHSKDLPKGTGDVATVVTHIVSNTPVESHVFVSLLYHRLLMVTTMDRTMWKVEGGKIENNGKFDK